MVRRFALLAFVVFALSYLVELALEHQGLVDSIGWWYTALVAAVYTVAITGLILLGRLLIGGLRSRSS